MNPTPCQPLVPTTDPDFAEVAESVKLNAESIWAPCRKTIVNTILWPKNMSRAEIGFLIVVKKLRHDQGGSAITPLFSIWAVVGVKNDFFRNIFFRRYFSSSRLRARGSELEAHQKRHIRTFLSQKRTKRTALYPKKVD